MEKSSHKSLQQQFNKVSFYVVAHADDWQIFMHPNVFDDLVSPTCKVIFIITTAGDSGRGAPFWMAREEGMKSSIRFCLAPLSVVVEDSGHKEFNGHSINWWSANNTTSYFLRLPDGNLDGNGFSSCNFQSLLRFKSGKINEIAALDNSASYQHWPDLVDTLESIINVESDGISNQSIHYLNPDRAENPNDHPDHGATGHLIQDMGILPTMHQLLYVGYSLGATIQQHLSSNEFFWKSGMFAAYEKAVYDACGYSTLQEDKDLYLRWCCSQPSFLQVSPVIVDTRRKMISLIKIYPS